MHEFNWTKFYGICYFQVHENSIYSGNEYEPWRSNGLDVWILKQDQKITLSPEPKTDFRHVLFRKSEFLYSKHAWISFDKSIALITLMDRGCIYI